MTRLEVRKNQGRDQADLFFSNTPKPPREKSDRSYVIDMDANKLSFFFQDLHFEGFPIIKAFKTMMDRLNRKDWLGL